MIVQNPEDPNEISIKTEDVLQQWVDQIQADNPNMPRKQVEKYAELTHEFIEGAAFSSLKNSLGKNLSEEDLRLHILKAVNSKKGKGGADYEELPQEALESLNLLPEAKRLRKEVVSVVETDKNNPSLLTSQKINSPQIRLATQEIKEYRSNSQQKKEGGDRFVSFRERMRQKSNTFEDFLKIVKKERKAYDLIQSTTTSIPKSDSHVFKRIFQKASGSPPTNSNPLKSLKSPISNLFKDGVSGGKRLLSKGLKSGASFMKNIGKEGFKWGARQLGGFLAKLIASPALPHILLAVGATLIYVYFSGQETEFLQVSNLVLNDPAVGGYASITPTCDPTTDPECAVAYCDPSENNCAWPTACGCITQGPNTGNPAQTHNTMNAIDIGVASCPGGTHADVWATHDGVVVKVVSSYAEDQIESASYGNEVRIEGVDDSGNTYVTLYTHLWIIAEYGDSGRIIQVGDVLQAGDPVGKTDNNGNTTGEHLHYEYQNGGDINTILPESVPGCSWPNCAELNICW